MQPVVERGVVDGDAARAAAERGRDFKDGDGNATAGEFHRRGHAGVTAADDGD